MSEELEARVAALEAWCAELEGIAQRALGEAMFAGLFAPNVIISQAREGMLNIEAIRMVIDQTSLICEREGARFPAMKPGFEIARSRAEASLRLLQPVPPEPR